jgi:DNA polymerase III delta subunit
MPRRLVTHAVNYLLCGENPLALDERIVELCQQLDPSALSTTVIDVQSSSVGEISAACQSMPFFGGSRVVVLKKPIAPPKRGDASADDGEDDQGGRVRWADLHQVLKGTPPTTSVIVRHDGKLAPGHYLRKALQALGWRIEERSVPRDSELLAWVTGRVERLGARIEPRAAQRLLDLLFPGVWQKQASTYDAITVDMRLLATELDKLMCAAQDDTLTLDEVEALVADRGGYTAFKLNTVIFEGNTEAALGELEKMQEMGEPAERVLGQLAGEASALFSVQLAREFGTKATAEASGIGEGRIITLQRKSRPVSSHALVTITEAIRHVDISVKLGNAPDTAALITPLVAEIAEAVRADGGSRRGRR